MIILFSETGEKKEAQSKTCIIGVSIEEKRIEQSRAEPCKGIIRKSHKCIEQLESLPGAIRQMLSHVESVPILQCTFH